MTKRKSPAREIAVDESKCSRCFMCQLVCSFSTTRVFNPGAARISITWDHEGDCRISFKDDCTKCALCAKYCVYGALTVATGSG